MHLDTVDLLINKYVDLVHMNCLFKVQKVLFKVGTKHYLARTFQTDMHNNNNNNNNNNNSIITFII